MRFWIAPAIMAVLALVNGAAVGDSLVRLTPHTNSVPVFGKIEFSIALEKPAPAPFDPGSGTLDMRFVHADGRQWTVPGFWMQPYERRILSSGRDTRDWFYLSGQPGWRARFAPPAFGDYTATAIWMSGGNSHTSAPVAFTCTPVPGRKGYLQVARADPRFLEFSTGEPFFAIGQNLAFIGTQQYVTPSRASRIFEQLAANGANYLRIWTGCEDWAIAIEARKSAWFRSWDKKPRMAAIAGPDGQVRKCVQVDGATPLLTVNPSHPVALRPGTRYELTGMWKSPSNAVIRLEVPGDGSVTLQSDAWTPFKHAFTTGPTEHWMPRIAFRLERGEVAWLDALSLREAGGGPELLWEADVNRPERGYYNPIDCAMVDELVNDAERAGLYLQLCLLTRDVYMNSLTNASSPEYDQAIADAKKTFRYAVGRWGYSTSVGAWEYWNEMNPGLPTDRFYTELGLYLEQIDPCRHLRTTSTWGPSEKDCRHPKLDIADVHFYLRPSDAGRLRNEVEAVTNRTAWLRQHAPAKPARLGEFGLANEQWQITDLMRRSTNIVEVHNALWASALSGASGTALFWWWERMDQRNAYPLYKPLSAFIADVPWNRGTVETLRVAASGSPLIGLGLRSGGDCWVWVFHPEAAWAETVARNGPSPRVSGASIVLSGLPDGPCRARWIDTFTGNVIREQDATVSGGAVRLTCPEFTSDVACRLSPVTN